jgi:hypothetical protein
MKNKLLISSLMIASSCLNAATSDDIKITNYHEETTGEGVTGHLIMNSNQTVSDGTVSATTNWYSGRLYQNIIMEGKHNYYLHNDTKQTENYLIQISLCADVVYCFKASYNVNMPPNRTYNATNTSLLTKSFNTIGDHPLVARIGVTGALSGENSGQGGVAISRN